MGFASDNRSTLGMVFLAVGLFFALSTADAANAACRNDFPMVKVNWWADGVKKEPIGGMGAAFGSVLPNHAKQAQKFPAAFPEPLNSCTVSSSKLSGSIALAERGDCEFMNKAQVAQAGGAAGLVVMNTDDGLVEMGCTNDTTMNISIPVATISKSAGEQIKKLMEGGTKVELLIYSPNRPVVDYSLIFLCLMAVGTIFVASLWSRFTGSEDNDERYNALSPRGLSNGLRTRRSRIEESDVAAAKDEDKEILNITVTTAIVFVITASTFLVLLYFFMSTWFVWVLVVLFCIGGVEGMHNCIVSLILSKCKCCGRKTVNLPFLGEVSILSLVVLVLCVAFAVAWAVKRKASYAWIGQDILGICMLITVLQLIQLPNIKVATVLLCVAFIYDIFWVFLSPYIFHDSVMISVARGDKAGGESIPMLLKFPWLADPYHGFSMIGFGDILFPGLLVCFSYRFDKAMKKTLLNGYFLWLILGYVLGLSLTYLAVFLMNGHGQPALLYLVPCTLGPCITLGLIRGEMRQLWSYGTEEPNQPTAPGEV